MKQYRYDTHVHTAESSACAVCSGETMARFYKQAGYTGIFITDHYLNANTTADRTAPWEEQVNTLCAGWESARRAGDKIGLDVFFGFEYSYRGTDILVYGLDKAWLLAHPETVTMELREFLALVRRSEGFSVHAHPFRTAAYIEMIRLVPNDVDAVETINIGNTDKLGKNVNRLAASYAAHFGLPITSGSDAHGTGNCCRGGILTGKQISTPADYATLIRSKSSYSLLGE